MAVYLVTWDLNNEKPNYIQARARFLTGFDGLEWIRDERLDSVRFVSTNLTAQQLHDRLHANMDGTDRIAIIRLNTDATIGHQGSLSSTVWEWINARLFSFN